MTDELTDEELSRMKPARDVLKPELFEKLTGAEPYEKRAREVADGVLHGKFYFPALAPAIASALREAANNGIRFCMTSSEIYSTKQHEDSIKLTPESSDWLTVRPDRVKPGELSQISDAHREARIRAYQHFFASGDGCHATSSRADQSVSRESALQSNSEKDAQKVCDLTTEADKHVEEITRLRNEADWRVAELACLRKLLQEAGEVIEPFIRWKDQMENHPHVLSTKCTFDDDDIPFTVTPEWKDLRRVKAFSEKIKGVMQSSKEDAQ